MSDKIEQYKGGYNNSGVSDGARRVGAGGVKTGLPLIITGGRQRFELFHNNFTVKGKLKREPKAGECELEIVDKGERRDLLAHVVYILPRNYCPDCDKNDKLKEKGAINVWTLYDGSIEFNIKPGEAVITCWCQECQMHEYYGSKIIIPGMDEAPEKMDEWRKKQIRQIRMDRNIVEYIRNRLLVQDWSIIVDPELKRRVMENG